MPSGQWQAALALLTVPVLASGGATAGELTALPHPLPAPALELPDLAGRVHRLEDYRGQVVLVNFWATWCPPCVAELPAMRRLAERLAGHRFALLAVNAGEGKGRIYKFLEVLGPVDFPVLLDGSRRAYDRWEVQVLPTSYLIDPQGSIRFRVIGAVEWDGNEALEAIAGLLTQGPQPPRSADPRQTGGAGQGDAAPPLDGPGPGSMPAAAPGTARATHSP